MEILPKSFYERAVASVAKALLGKIIVRQWRGYTLSGIIIETEAYGASDDPASHAFIRQNLRNKAMFGPTGHSYIYMSYGSHYCLNLVARNSRNLAGGVLIRNIIPIEGIEVMKKLRHTTNINTISNGPGKIGQALALNISHNNLNLTVKGKLYITQGIKILSKDIETTARIGIRKGLEKQWRFIIKPTTINSYECKIKKILDKASQKTF